MNLPRKTRLRTLTGKKKWVRSGSTASDQATVHHPVRHSGRADVAIVTHNTLSADITHVQVFYPYHPLHGYRLRVIRRPKGSDGAVSVLDAAGKRLKIPVWMLSPAAANVKTTEQALLSREALLNLTSLLIQATVTGVHDNLLQPSMDGCKGDHHAATTVEPGPNRRGTRAHRRNGPSRTGRTHGSHSSDGFSNTSKED